MSNPTSLGYSIGRPTRVCAATGQPLVPGESFVAALVEAADGALVRHDFSFAAWHEGHRPPPPARVVGSWRSRVTAPGEKPSAILDDAAMIHLLAQLNPREPRHESIRFVLALMLVRRRLLVQEASDGETLVFRLRGQPLEGSPFSADDSIRVRDPRLGEAAMIDTIAQLEAVAADPALAESDA